MASTAERPQDAAPQSTAVAPTLSTDRPAPAGAPVSTGATSHWPDEAYRGWASL